MRRMVAVPTPAFFGTFPGVFFFFFFRFDRPCLPHPVHASTGCPECAAEAEVEALRRERRAKRQPPLIMEYAED